MPSGTGCVKVFSLSMFKELNVFTFAVLSSVSGLLVTEKKLTTGNSAL